MRKLSRLLEPVMRPGWIASLLFVAGVIATYHLPLSPGHRSLREGHAWLAGHVFPPVPRTLAPRIPEDRVRVSLLRAGELAQVREMIDPRAVALDEGQAVARMDGHVFATDAASVRAVADRLGWDGLTVDVASGGAEAALVLAADRTPVPSARSLHFRTFTALGGLRDLANRNMLLATALLAGIAAFAFWRIARLVRASLPQREPADDEAADPGWTRPAGRLEVKVVLVADHAALAAVRTAIGEEHILASSRDAFAFAHGWILAVRHDTVFQLMGELGWADRPLRLWESGALPEQNAAAVIRGATQPSGRGEVLSVIDALHLVGPIAHDGGAASG